MTNALRTKTHMTSSRCLPPSITAAGRSEAQGGIDVMSVARSVGAVAAIGARVKTGATQESEGEETHTPSNLGRAFGEN